MKGKEVETKLQKTDEPEKPKSASPEKNVPTKEEEKPPKDEPSEDDSKEASNSPSPAAGSGGKQAGTAAGKTFRGRQDEPSPKPSKPVNPFANFFSPKSGSAGGARNEGGGDYQAVVKRSSYHPVRDAFWKREEKTPYLALAKTLQAIEETSGRLKTIEILANYFRSVMVQTPDDLLPSIYMTLNRLAPAWEGTELGIGETLLMKVSL